MLAALIPLLLQLQAPSAPAQIILIRHAEKPADTTDPHLSAAGRARAAGLVRFLRKDPVVTKFGPPVALFATATTKDGDGVRTQETLAPAAGALTLPVQTPFLGKQYADLAKQILVNQAYAGKTIIVCWNHEYLPQLAAALGVTPKPPKWKGSDFDGVYVITYTHGSATMSRMREQLSKGKGGR